MSGRSIRIPFGSRDLQIRFVFGIILAFVCMQRLNFLKPMKARGAKMKTSGIKFLVLVVALFFLMGSVAHALSLSENQSLTATLESSIGFGSFTFFWGVDGWSNGANMDYTLYDTEDNELVRNDIAWLYEYTSGSYNVRSDFDFPTYTENYVKLVFSVAKGEVLFKDMALDWEKSENVNGPLSASLYDVSTSTANKEAVERTVYSQVIQNGNSFNASPVPEPATWALFTIGIIGLAALRNNKAR